MISQVLLSPFSNLISVLFYPYFIVSITGVALDLRRAGYLIILLHTRTRGWMCIATCHCRFAAFILSVLGCEEWCVRWLMCQMHRDTTIILLHGICLNERWSCFRYTNGVILSRFPSLLRPSPELYPAARSPLHSKVNGPYSCNWVDNIYSVVSSLDVWSRQSRISHIFSLNSIEDRGVMRNRQKGGNVPKWHSQLNPQQPPWQSHNNRSHGIPCLFHQQYR